jgi:hypothetical protein
MLIGAYSPIGTSVAFGPTLSPTPFDPFNLDALRRALGSEIDFSCLREPTCPKLLVATARVRDGQLRIFRKDEITADVVLASTCPPLNPSLGRGRRRGLLGWHLCCKPAIVATRARYQRRRFAGR